MRRIAKRTNATGISKLLDYIEFNADVLRNNVKVSRAKHKKISLNAISLNAILAHVHSILKKFPVSYSDCPALLALNELTGEYLKCKTRKRNSNSVA